jgi:hypothetical protein
MLGAAHKLARVIELQISGDAEPGMVDGATERMMAAIKYYNDAAALDALDYTHPIPKKGEQAATEQYQIDDAADEEVEAAL